MPNPLTRAQRIISKRVPDRPEPIPPVEEHYSGHNNAYRGIEDHAAPGGVYVDHGSTYTPVPVWTQDDRNLVVTTDSPGPDPIPVRIVDHSKRDVQGFFTQQVTMTAGTSMMLVAKDDRRIRTQLFVVSGSMFIGSDANVTNWTGYPLLRGSTLDELPPECAVYAYAEQDTTIAILLVKSL